MKISGATTVVSCQLYYQVPIQENWYSKQCKGQVRIKTRRQNCTLGKKKMMYYINSENPFSILYLLCFGILYYWCTIHKFHGCSSGIVLWRRAKKTEQCFPHTAIVYVGGLRGLRINTLHGKEGL